MSLFSPTSSQKINFKFLFLLLTIAAGILILLPLNNFQVFLAQGDHGRELFAYQKVADGATPYRDFAWLFGPLMPYYYSIFYHIFGVSIQSILFGQNLLILAVGIIIYLTCALFMNPAFSFIGALWYWTFRDIEFFYSYHHIGGIVFLLLALYFTLKYIKDAKPSSVYLGFLSVFLLMLIRLNMGIAIMMALGVSLFIIDSVKKDQNSGQKRKIYIFLSLTAVLATAFIYWWLLNPLPGYEIHQNLPYSKAQRADATFSIIDSLIGLLNFLFIKFSFSWLSILFCMILATAILRLKYLIFKRKLAEDLHKRIALIFISLFLFIFFGLHEYLASGVDFRIVWVTHIFIITMFYILFYFFETGSKLVFTTNVKGLAQFALLSICFLSLQSNQGLIQSFKTPDHLLKIGKNRVYVSQQPQWFYTVYATMDFINKNIPPEDKILVLPHDALYYFLSQRDNAARQLVFFEHTNITSEQEKAIIDELEQNDLKWILLSSRMNSQEPGMGQFGVTHCPLLAEYFDKNFEEVIKIGDWHNPPGWVTAHGMKVLKRIKE